MSLEPANGARLFTPIATLERVSVASAPTPAFGAAAVAVAPAAGEDEALEFVRFCYRRRRVGWTALYDEMSAVAARSAFRGMGYCELAERGISFCLGELPRLVALAERVAREEALAELAAPSASLRLAPAG